MNRTYNIVFVWIVQLLRLRHLAQESGSTPATTPDRNRARCQRRRREPPAAGPACRTRQRPIRPARRRFPRLPVRAISASSSTTFPTRTLLERFAQMANKPLVADTNLQGTVTFNDPKPYTYQEALDTLNLMLSMKDMTLVESDHYLRLVPLKTASANAAQDSPRRRTRPGMFGRAKWSRLCSR